MQTIRATWLFLPALALGGCPMYPDGCSTDYDCGPAYVCDYPSGQCLAAAYPANPSPGVQRCSTTDDCAPGLICDRYARCAAPTQTGGTSGSAGTASAGASNASGAAGENSAGQSEAGATTR